jgi:putative metallohydrolase (TIGR04338 family)
VRQPRDTQRSRLYAAEREAWKGAWEANHLLEPVTDRMRREWIERWDRENDYQRSIQPTWPSGEQAWTHARLDLEARYEFVDDFIARVQAGLWWRVQGYRRVWRDQSYRGYSMSHGSPDEGYVQIGRHHFNRWVVLHEMAHAAQPLGTAWHGREFCSIYLKLVERWIGKDEARALRVAMVKHKVKHRATRSSVRQRVAA